MTHTSRRRHHARRPSDADPTPSPRAAPVGGLAVRRPPALPPPTTPCRRLRRRLRRAPTARSPSRPVAVRASLARRRRRPSSPAGGLAAPRPAAPPRPPHAPSARRVAAAKPRRLGPVCGRPRPPPAGVASDRARRRPRRDTVRATSATPTVRALRAVVPRRASAPRRHRRRHGDRGRPLGAGGRLQRHDAHRARREGRRVSCARPRAGPSCASATGAAAASRRRRSSSEGRRMPPRRCSTTSPSTDPTSTPLASCRRTGRVVIVVTTRAADCPGSLTRAAPSGRNGARRSRRPRGRLAPRRRCGSSDPRRAAYDQAAASQ